MLIRGTTPIIRFSYKTLLPSEMAEVYMTITQKGENLVEKTKDEAEIGSYQDGGQTVYYLQWGLSQEETLLIDANRTVSIQTRVKMNDGSVFASQVYTIRGYDVLKEGVI